MSQKGFAKIVVIIGFVILVGVAGYFVVNQQASSPAPIPSPTSSPTPTPSPAPAPTPIAGETKCTDYSVVKINDDQGFIYTYNNDSELQAIPEKNFEGILKEYNKLPPGVGTTVQRELAYNLDGKAVYTAKNDLSKYVGKRVILRGKNYKFELEGTQRDEIWPVSIVCR